MDTRIKINITVVGEPGAGKETFAKMLFLENVSKIRVTPLSILAEMYMEIDHINFQITSKKTIEECKQHNNLIMQQKEINSVGDLRNKGLQPMFYKNTKRIRDLINFEVNSSNKNPRMSKNVLLNFYFIGNNFRDFEEEISSSNIIIYITDVNKTFKADNDLFIYISKLVKESNNKKYLLTLVNKCDNLNSNGDVDVNSQYYNNIASIDEIIRKLAQESDAHQNILPLIPISFKYAHIYRQFLYYSGADISNEDKVHLCNIFNVKPDVLVKDINKNSRKYLKRSGFICFRDILADILNTKYKSMIDDNFEIDIQKLKKIIIAKPDDFPKHLESFRKKALRTEKLFKKDYVQFTNPLVKFYLEKVCEIPNPNLSGIEHLMVIYQEDNELYKHIMDTHSKIKNKFFALVTDNLYNSELCDNTFLPSQVHIIYDKFVELYPPKSDIDKFSTYICDLYSTKAKFLLSSEKHINLLFDAYFNENEYIKMMSMLNDITSKMDFDKFKIYLIQILLTKLMVVENCIKFRDSLNKHQVDTIIEYCNSLRHYLMDNTHKQYDYLFSNICDICTNIIFRLDGFSHLQYLSDNLFNVIKHNPNRIIKFEKFIVKTIKKYNYKSLLATDQNDSDDDSDIDIDGNESSNFDFTKDDMKDVPSEENDDEISDTDETKTNTTRKNKKNKSTKTKIVDV
ncbi:putative ORFan [Tupanvirus deep ocean]|uniref:ORFan n=2 Tax=Tupanvirus TaxID=2094720 RepID=A0AC62A769_9VIRU|nr:putative ORFan [Tupanvirus deep ocean]QKU33631.1 putative ORFan [Tupanvirus deep ocean]